MAIYEALLGVEKYVAFEPGSKMFMLQINKDIVKSFCPWTFSLNIGLNIFPLDSCLHSLLGYSTEDFQALQLIVPAAFGAVD